MSHQKFTPRADYRIAQAERTKASPTLSHTFHDLKALTVEFGYFTAEGISRNSNIKYTVNPDFAKSVFRLDCMNCECIAGDFDLSTVIAQAVADQETLVTGEMSCKGWLSKTTIDSIHCRNILRYKLSLEFGSRKALEVPQLQPA